MVPLIHDKDGVRSFCVFKDHVDERIRRSGSVIMFVKFRDCQRGILALVFWPRLFTLPHEPLTLLFAYILLY
ncbi:hypothetical protein PVAP13_7NG107478 [Panicum virgatum]|uniref:Uncharacterized protein n=1 Tax=Panicum virgatum TaxID=38727 RepID=A0A8T0PUY8_PANVG|nr:hypothetical protein PVAP13_7NG107478 [Panicum virgatum]